jgi:hypothetical protein
MSAWYTQSDAAAVAQSSPDGVKQFAACHSRECRGQLRILLLRLHLLRHSRECDATPRRGKVLQAQEPRSQRRVLHESMREANYAFGNAELRHARTI